MRIASWNLNHRARPRTIPGWIISEVAATKADVMVCTEYVEGKSHRRFVSDLRAAGFLAVNTTPVTPGQNQVLIASRASQELGTLRPPSDIDETVPSNALHVSISGTHLIGFRMPAFNSSAEHLKRRTWQWVREAAAELRDTPALIVGDMNTQRGDPQRYCGDCIEILLGDGWSEVIPSSGYSWKHARSGTSRRIDYGFASPRLIATNADYSWDFVARNAIAVSKAGIPDHALLLIDVQP
jgi:exonuclease III